MSDTTISNGLVASSFLEPHWEILHVLLLASYISSLLWNEFQQPCSTYAPDCEKIPIRLRQTHRQQDDDIHAKDIFYVLFPIAVSAKFCLVHIDWLPFAFFPFIATKSIYTHNLAKTPAYGTVLFPCKLVLFSHTSLPPQKSDSILHGPLHITRLVL